MKRHRTPIRREGLRALTLFSLILLTAPALAATCPEVKFGGPASLNLPDFTASGSNWVSTVASVSGQPSSPKTNQGGLYQWTQVSGPAVSLVNATSSQVQFNAPDVGAAGANVVLRLTVTGCGGSASDTYRVNITDAHDIVVNSPPHAVPSASPASAQEGQQVVLDGSASNDPDGNPLAFSWAQIGGPAVTLSTPNQAIATFVAPNLTSTTTLTFALTVSDGALLNTNTTLVSVVWNNDPPIAALNCPLQVNEGQPLTLDGSASSDSDDGIASYQWRQLVGLPVVPGIDASNANTFVFNAPQLGYLQVGLVPFELTVTDAHGAMSAATCAVFIHDVTAPSILGAADIEVDAASADGTPVGFALTAADAVDGDLTSLLQCTPASGSVFPMATTSVSCQVSDSASNLASTGFNVTVGDHSAPTIGLHNDVAVEAESPQGAPVNYTPASTSDAVDGPGTATCLPPPGQFPLESTIVLCDASDHTGNHALQTHFTVTVHDTLAPVFAAYGPVTPVEASGPAGAPVNFALPSATDLVDGPVPVNCTPISGSTFAIGTTSVHCGATDVHSNSASFNFDVSVIDSTPPVISGVSDDLVGEATSAAGAAVTFALPTAIDVVDGSVTVICAPASGSTFALGTSTVTCSASDAHSNTATAGFTITVQDTTPPVITGISPDLTVEATSGAGAAMSYALPSASDLVDGPVSVSCVAPSGSVFALGPHTVSCSATDAHSNTATARFTATVQDTTPPVITGVSADLMVEATSGAGAAMSYALPSASDLVDGPVAVSCASASGSVFPLGDNTVICSAQDTHSNVVSASFHITVRDTTAPTLAGLVDLVLEATSSGGAIAAFHPTASDAVDPSVSVLCSSASGATFALGLHTVSCSATDFSHNTATGSFTVTVRDTTAPTLAGLVDLVLEATSPDGTIAAFHPTAIDAVDLSVSVLCSPASGSTFALGLHTVSCSASDFSHNTMTGSFTVRVRDTTPPTLTYHEDVVITGTTMSSATVSYTPPSAQDIVSGDVAVQCTPTSGATFTVGMTTVNCSASDGAGNTATSSFKVTVKYAWTGFLRPIDNLPTVNSAKAGSAIPVKFSLGGNQGMGIFAAGYPKSAAMLCQGAVQDVVEETVTAGSSSLQYDAGSGQYIYVWKTDKAWTGSCRQLQIKFADGTTQVANFSFTR